jgi:hypothetical protein
MTPSIAQFLRILADNDYETKTRDIPDDFDNADELKAELAELDIVPDFMLYYVLNNNRTPSALDAYLNKSFKEFRLEFLTNKHDKNKLVVGEITDQLNTIIKDIDQSIYVTSQIKDDDLTKMINIKKDY